MLSAFERLSLTSTQFYTQISTSQFSQELQNNPPIKHIDSILIHNFKSFKGTVYVGPLLDFTSIVGPNGAGKSNVLDALMFCFCNQKSKQTFFDLREFITREGLQSYNQMMSKDKYCSVEAKFILQNDRVLAFERKLHSNEEQIFRINGEEYPQRVYQNYLIKNNINFITSNFAIWQGEIDKFLLKNPKDLTNHIETVSGSIFFKKQQQELQNEISEIERYNESRAQRLSKLRLQKKHLKSFNNQQKQTIQIQKEYQELMKQIVLAKTYLSEFELKAYQHQIQQKEEKQRVAIRQINEAKVELQRQQSRRGILQTQIKNLLKTIAQNHAQLRNGQQLNAVIDVQTASELEQQIQSLQKYHDHIRVKKDGMQRQLSYQGSNDINKEYLQLYNQWSNKNEAIGKQLAKRKEQYLYTEGILQSKRNILEEFRQKQTKLQDTVQQEQRQKVALETNIQALAKNISKMKGESSKMTEEFTKSRTKIQKVQQKLIETNQKLIELDSLVSESMGNEKDKDLQMKLTSVEGFKGVVSEWVKPAHKKYEVCFHMMMAPILKYLLCTNQSSAKQITVKLRENYQIRNLLILNNVHEKKEQVARANLGKFGSLALEAVTFQKGLSQFDWFLKDYLNGKVICDNLTAAWTMLAQNVKGVREIYTLDGNVLKSDGTVSSYGSVELNKNNYRYINVAKNTHVLRQDIQTLTKEKQQYEKEISVLKKNSNDEAMLKHSLEIQRLQTKKTELGLKVDFLKKSMENKKDVKSPKDLNKQIKELESRAKTLSGGVEEIQKQMLQSNIFSTFIKKNKIDGLGNFREVEDLSSLQDTMKQRLRLTKQLEQAAGEVSKVSTQIAQKEERLSLLNEKLKGIKNTQDKAELSRTVKRQEDQLATCRAELSKMKNVSFETLKFKSQVGQMKAKFQLMKQRQKKLIQEQVESCGLVEMPRTDYRHLEEKSGVKLQRATKSMIERVIEDLQQEKADLLKDMEKNNIGLADLRLQNTNEKVIEEQINRISEQLKEASIKKNQLTDKSDKVKEDRKAVFMNFMNNLKPLLQSTYETLTLKGNSSGRADIFMENESFPCDQGLYYTPVPPTKRFIYDLDQLSGGQKSIASLALQYAIAITSKSPFLVLDETDAFLDAENTKRFINLIRKTSSDQRLQFMVITHKKGLYEQGDSLVGLTKFKDNPYSKAFSLRLNEEEEDQIDS